MGIVGLVISTVKLVTDEIIERNIYIRLYITYTMTPKQKLIKALTAYATLLANQSKTRGELQKKNKTKFESGGILTTKKDDQIINTTSIQDRLKKLNR